MKIKKTNLTKLELNRSQKILLSLYQEANGTNKSIRFEDIAVAAFKNFPSDFQLRGYPQYPDTGDIIHKPLYSELKKGGYVLSGDKYFSLTQRGIAYAKKILQSDDKISSQKSGSGVRIRADQQRELERLQSSKAVELYFADKKDEILDIDFYEYLEVTVRTDKNMFLGRLETVEDAINAVRNKNQKVYQKLSECHKYLVEKFKQNIEAVKNSKGGKR